VAAVAGMTTMALFAWSYFRWRLSRIANALEHTLDSDPPTQLRVGGIPAERRLARAFNAAAGTYLQTEARASADKPPCSALAGRCCIKTILARTRCCARCNG